MISISYQNSGSLVVNFAVSWNNVERLKKPEDNNKVNLSYIIFFNQEKAIDRIILLWETNFF